jgi:hypothetical protein
VTITLTGASLTINGVTYTTSTTINLGPGTYPYTWTALPGYIGSGGGSLVVGDCTPPDATASVSLGACSWTEATGSLTPVTITLTGASLTINGVTYTTSTTINLGPGTYPYTWTALSGYKGSGGGSVVIGDCTPGNASASLSTGTCTWTEAAGSLTPVTITLSNASFTINGQTYTTSTTINLPPGSYSYTWTALPGYRGSGSGTVVIGNCTPPNATASVSTGTCAWTQATGSLTPVTIALTGASLTINSQTYTTSTVINLPPGSYPYTWTALPGYRGSGSGTIVVGDCTPFLSLVLTGICADQPTVYDGWKVDNSNPYLVSFEYAIDGGVSGVGTVPANSTAYFDTPVGSGTGVMSLFVNGIWQNNATAATGCIENPPPAPPENPVNPVIPLIPVTGPVPAAGPPSPAVLIPVTGLDMGMLGRTLPGTLFGLSFSFAGLGLVLSGFARRRED